MAKRSASEAVEEVAQDVSPATKKARIESKDGNENGFDTSEGLPKPTRSVSKQYADGNRRNGTPDSEYEQEPSEEEQEAGTGTRQRAPVEGYNDLYLDTIDRIHLDFDFEKLCSVTLSNINVYACLVCGKYFQGRGPKSQAYFHALEESHHVYINMENKRVYVLPEGYEVQSRSLEDIKFVVDPWLPRQEVLQLDKEQKTAWDLTGRKYTPGFVGMNNLKANDYFNVVMHALAHVPPLRNYFMLEDLSGRPQLAQRFGILVRKIWNPKSFKSHVSPHELLQEVALRSGKRFTLTEQSDPVDFISWFLNNLHASLGGSMKKANSSIVHRVFQGSMKIESQAITARADAGDRLRFENADVQSQTQRFMMLTLDLPAAPLFADALDPTNVIPQVPLTSLLSKYDGVKAQEKLNTRIRYRLLHPLPPYLIMHIKRFSKNKFVSERNPTIVTFPTRSLDVSSYVEPNPAVHPPAEPIWYDLVANVTHEAVKIRDDSVEGEAERKIWRVHIKDKSRDRWLEVQDLFVDQATADTVFTKESYLQIWERRKMDARKRGK